MAYPGTPPPAGQPISVHLIAQSAIGLLQRHWAILWPLAAALFFLPQLLISATAPTSHDHPPHENFASLPFILVGIFVITLTVIGQLTVAFIAVRNGTDGRTVGKVLRRSGRRLIPALAVIAAQSIATLVGMILLVIPGLWMLARLSLAMPIIATDSDDPVAALRQSWRLTDGQALRILACLAVPFGVALLLYLLVMILGSGTGAIPPPGSRGDEAVVAAFGQWGVARWLFELASAALVAFVGLLTTSFYAALLVALRRQAKEGR